MLHVIRSRLEKKVLKWVRGPARAPQAHGARREALQDLRGGLHLIDRHRVAEVRRQLEPHRRVRGRRGTGAGPSMLNRRLRTSTYVPLLRSHVL